ncbi:MAG: DoxX family protein, partial [Chloroflexi bacterium]|nr:DoxX family protein [Chloroflexota bacterium]
HSMLAVVFVMTGAMKLLQKKEGLIDKMDFMKDFSQGQINRTGMLEIMGAMGLILPLETGILSWLTSVAAVGLAVTMVGAFLTHLR